MQLERENRKPKSIRTALAMAACTLLGSAVMAAADIEESPIVENSRKGRESSRSEDLNNDSWLNFQKWKKTFSGWKIDAALLYYQEPERVTAIEPVIQARKGFDTDEYLTLKLVVDTLTGASHNGATATDTVQTFTRPSGVGTYTAQPGETPLDDTFRDTRVAAGVQWEQPLSARMKGSLGGNFSKEYDFTSIGANGALSYDFNGKNTTVSAGFSYEGDRIDPEGGIPIPFASMAAPGAAQPRSGDSDDKTVVDGLLGLTQVINKNALAQLNYSISRSSGYHTDPFKLLSVVEGAAGPSLGDTVDYIFEKRPDSRNRQALFALTKYAFGKNAADVSYRYYWDDWGVRSHTVDFHYRWTWSEGKNYLEPHLRLYTQTPADFYRHSLLDTEATPEFATADYRLGDLDAVTLGLKYGRNLKNGHSYSVRFEYYLQSGDPSPDGGVGSQQAQDLFPSVDAFIAQVIYSL